MHDVLEDPAELACSLPLLSLAGSGSISDSR
jgi:hypothetical protein